ncbi:MAG TPA: periplasmic heavy metal sensor [Candidatus Krumholzibacteria bacterium]|nr:periplasmic heavy metal sensor [Candidatus Krumholzibacteria bacterium]
MKIRWLVAALVILIVMNVAAIGAFLFVQVRHPRPAIGWSQLAEDATRHPLGGLRPEERRKLYETMKEFHGEIRDLYEETHALEADAIASMNQDPVPRAHIDSLLQQIADNRLEIARRATDRIISMSETLTPEEREHLMSAVMRMRGGRGGDPDRPRRGKHRRQP